MTLSDKISDEHADYDAVLSVFVVKRFIKVILKEIDDKKYEMNEDIGKTLCQYIKEKAGEKLL